MSLHGFKMKNPSSLSSLRSASQTKRCGDGNSLHRRCNESSWRWSWSTASPFCQNCRRQLTASWARATQLRFKKTVPSPMWAQPLSTYLLLLSSPTGTHPVNTGPRRPHSITPSLHSPIIGRPREHATTGDAGTSPPCHGPGPDFQEKIRGSPGSTVPRVHHDPGAPEQHNKLHVISRRSPWPIWALNPSNDNMAMPYWPLWGAIW